MKNKKHTFLGILLLQVFILTSTTNVFAFSEPVLDLDSRKGEFFQADHNRQAVLIEESIAEISFQNSSEFETDFSPFYPEYLAQSFSNNLYSESSDHFDFQTDFRNILKTQIYPFHSFW